MPVDRPATEWLRDREPPAPPALSARVAELLGDAPFVDAADAVRRCVDAAERAVAALLRDGCTTRASALDLLAADALATYAFELAAEAPEALGTIADAALRRFAALGATADSSGART